MIELCLRLESRQNCRDKHPYTIFSQTSSGSVISSTHNNNLSSSPPTTHYDKDVNMTHYTGGSLTSTSLSPLLFQLALDRDKDKDKERDGGGIQSPRGGGGGGGVLMRSPRQLSTPLLIPPLSLPSSYFLQSSISMPKPLSPTSSPSSPSSNSSPINNTQSTPSFPSTVGEGSSPPRVRRERASHLSVRSSSSSSILVSNNNYVQSQSQSSGNLRPDFRNSPDQLESSYTDKETHYSPELLHPHSHAHSSGSKLKPRKHDKTSSYESRYSLRHPFSSSSSSFDDASRTKLRSLEKYLPLINPLLEPHKLEDTYYSLRVSEDKHTKKDLTEMLLVRLLLEEAAHSPQPFLLLFDNAQWFDTCSLSLLYALASATHKIGVIIFTRPLFGKTKKQNEGLYNLPGIQILNLGPLGEEGCTQLSLSKFKAKRGPPLLFQTLFQKAHGNPLIIEEMCNQLLVSSSVSVINGVLTLASSVEDDLTTLSIPDTVQGLITSRIDMLVPTLQLVLKTASVIGREFSEELLLDIIPVAAQPQEIHSSLQQLVSLDLLTPSPLNPSPSPRFLLTNPNTPPLSPPSSSTPSSSQDCSYYSFKSKTIHEVSYNTTPFKQRIDLHRKVAEWVESHFQDLAPFYSTLAHHWSNVALHSSSSSPNSSPSTPSSSSSSSSASLSANSSTAYGNSSPPLPPAPISVSPSSSGSSLSGSLGSSSILKEESFSSSSEELSISPPSSPSRISAINSANLPFVPRPGVQPPHLNDHILAKLKAVRYLWVCAYQALEAMGNPEAQRHLRIANQICKTLPPDSVPAEYGQIVFHLRILSVAKASANIIASQDMPSVAGSRRPRSVNINLHASEIP